MKYILYYIIILYILYKSYINKHVYQEKGRNNVSIVSASATKSTVFSSAATITEGGQLSARVAPPESKWRMGSFSHNGNNHAWFVCGTEDDWAVSAEYQLVNESVTIQMVLARDPNNTIHVYLCTYLCTFIYIILSLSLSLYIYIYIYKKKYINKD